MFISTKKFVSKHLQILQKLQATSTSKLWFSLKSIAFILRTDLKKTN